MKRHVLQGNIHLEEIKIVLIVGLGGFVQTVPIGLHVVPLFRVPLSPLRPTALIVQQGHNVLQTVQPVQVPVKLENTFLLNVRLQPILCVQHVSLDIIALVG